MSIHFFFFFPFFFCLVRAEYSFYSSISIQKLLFNLWLSFSSGWINALITLGTNVGAGAFMIFVALFLTAYAVVNIIVLIKVWRCWAIISLVLLLLLLLLHFNHKITYSSSSFLLIQTYNNYILKKISCTILFIGWKIYFSICSKETFSFYKHVH